MNDDKELDEKKLSYYSLILATEAKNSLLYIRNLGQAKKLSKAISDFFNAYKKLGGK